MNNKLDDYKLPLRHWLVNQVDAKRFPGLEWTDESKTKIKIPWTPQNHPGWEESYKLFEVKIPICIFACFSILPELQLNYTYIASQ